MAKQFEKTTNNEAAHGNAEADSIYIRDGNKLNFVYKLPYKVNMYSVHVESDFS
ncbi:MAG: hypothetical protein JRF05_08370 [Deltaproteobacteria bacterium]|jgi:hypothetical protein|nr:hypothetical protein [Deltaproteobacteria bacterium]